MERPESERARAPFPQSHRRHNRCAGGRAVRPSSRAHNGFMRHMVSMAIVVYRHRMQRLGIQDMAGVLFGRSSACFFTTPGGNAGDETRSIDKIGIVL